MFYFEGVDLKLFMLFYNLLNNFYCNAFGELIFNCGLLLIICNLLKDPYGFNFMGFKGCFDYSIPDSILLLELILLRMRLGFSFYKFAIFLVSF